ncbi:MAG: transglycosylase domain-containing protein [Clostridia bacterium]|nr:transglycosylase domain-containing protein [Clostridia bacterium]
MEKEKSGARLGKRVKKVGTVTRRIARSTLWYPLKVLLIILWKAFTWIVNIMLTVLLIGMITGAVVACAFILYIRSNIDAEFHGLDNLRFDSSMNTTIYYYDTAGNEIMLENETLHGSENRMWVNYADIPQNLIDAVVAIEDQRFFQHNGVDYKRTAGAILRYFLPGSGQYGGSTITQQLIKNVSGDNEATIQRKVQEIFRAIYVTQHFGKEEILEMYLNVIFLSQNATGVQAAAEAYFGKDVKDLTLVECAALAAIPKYPTYYDPIRNPDNNLQRRNVILTEMLAQGYIDQEEFDSAYNVPLYLNSTRRETNEDASYIHSWYVDTVIDDALEELMEHYDIDKATASRKLYSGGLQIVINMNKDIQDAMEAVFTDDSCFPEISGIKPQAAMVVADPVTGSVLGIVGGRGKKTANRGYNLATQAKRQCGSSIKPLAVYGYGIDHGIITYASSIEDTPTINQEKDPETKKVTQKYWPPNSPEGYDGLMSLVDGIKRSKNTFAVRIAPMCGIENLFRHLVNKVGFTTLVESKNYNGVIKTDIALSPVALGSFTQGVTVREMTQGYTMFGNRGNVSKLKTIAMIRDYNGEVIIDNTESESSEAISEQSAYILTRLLCNVVNEEGGTAYKMFHGLVKGTVGGEKVPVPAFDFLGKVEVGGKTGTTNDNRDRYFVGITPNYAAAVWFGYENNKSVAKFEYNPALRLWIEVFNRVYGKLEANGRAYKTEFDEPFGIVKVKYCTISGKLPTEACYHDIETVTGGESCVRVGYFTMDTMPTEYCDRHIMFNWDSKTKAICREGCLCPEEDIIQVAFRLIEPRQFNTNLLVTDSQYTCVDESLFYEGYQYSTKTTRPYYFNIYQPYEEDQKLTWPGRSSKSDSFKPYNRICIEHYHPELLVPDAPDAPAEESEETNGN